MTKTVQNYTPYIVGLFFIAQSTIAPVAYASTLVPYSQSIYGHAATSADPIIFDNHENEDKSVVTVKTGEPMTMIKEVIAHIEGQVNVADNEEIDNSETTIDEVKAYVYEELRKAGLNTREGFAIVNCESKWDPLAINGKNKNGSNDKGLWQINSIHKSISDADKLDYKTATKWAINKRLAEGNWSAWSCSRKIAAK